ncbi:MAG TPA: dTDP-glucose 4,6-dehydratase [Gemmatimonadales bacterium]|nr:dTDP-glucose 4,6-dehydratase [Gemmatimonadales bacterium]
MNKQLLVTGGAGFIGSNFVHYWHEAHPDDRIVVLDALTYAGNLASLEPLLARESVEFVHGDIGDRPLVEGLLDRNRIETIVHFAAESHVDRSIAGPEAFIRTNVQGTFQLLEAARSVWLGSGIRAAAGLGASHRFHHISTDEVYGTLGPDDPPVTEASAYAPNSPYAASKAAADHLVRAYHRTYGLPVTTSNCSNNYGPHQFPEKLLPLMLIHALDGKPLPVYGDGRHVRDWLYVRDHCRGIGEIVTAGRIGETYNVGGEKERPNLQVVKLLSALIDQEFASDLSLASRFPNAPAVHREKTESLITYVPDRPGHDRRYSVDGGKLERELGYRPLESFQSGLQRTVRWYLDNESWWRGVMDGSYREWIRSHYGVA